MSGFVSIVGAGPGDPGLLTLKAAERLQAAQAVVYDALVRPEVVALAPPSARRIFAGKRAGGPCLAQSSVNRLLVALARQGLRVVRLKGGDPFLFGRGAEEALALRGAGVDFEVVPGVSSCLAAPAAAGIPVTERALSSMVTVVTGHSCAGGPGVDWKTLSPRGTLVVLMGLGELESICARLLALGWPERLPAAVLSSVGWPEQQTVVAPLGELAEAARRAGARTPAVVVVGEVVSLSKSLGGRDDVRARESIPISSRPAALPS